MSKILSAALAAMLSISAAQAQEITGGSVSLGYSGLTDSALDDINKVEFGGSLEVGLSQQFSIQGDLSVAKFGRSNFDGSSFGLHAIYHASPATSLGAFVTRDEIESLDTIIYGVEIGHQFGRGSVESYLARDNEDGGDATLFGLRADYAVIDQAKIGLRFDNVSFDGTDVSRTSITGEFAATEQLSLNAELGSARIDNIGSEPFIGIGARMNFGAKRGATFEKRSALDFLPGL